MLLLIILEKIYIFFNLTTYRQMMKIKNTKLKKSFPVSIGFRRKLLIF